MYQVESILESNVFSCRLANALRSADPCNSLGCAVKGNASTAPFKQVC